MTSIYIAIGTNQDDRQQNIRQAIELIQEIPDTKVVNSSQIREYAAEEIAVDQPPFLNGVILIESDLELLEVLHKLQVIERKLGRKTKGDGKPRAIDLDILSYGEDVIFEGKTLTIPHPRMHARRFVLEPLVEINPNWKHAKLDKTAKELLDELNQIHQNEDHSIASNTSETPPASSSTT